jgi:phosphorylcholine metabolism protein LicD
MSDNIKKLRQYYLDLLTVFDKVCKENKIQWFLWAGTLLGAIRHGGFIPWDDDIDATVFRSDIEKLLKAKWPDGYAFGSYRGDKMYTLCRSGTTMVNCKSKRSRRHINNGLAGIKLDIFPLFETVDKSGRGIKRYTTRFDSKKDHQIPAYWLGKGSSAKFEGLFFPVPQSYDDVLKRTYGDDYMTPRKYENHHTHFVDLYHGQEEYAAGKRKIPLSRDFKPTDGEVMFAKE